MAPRFEVGKSALRKRVCGDKPVIHIFTVDRLQRGDLLRREEIGFQKRQRLIADDIVHAEALPKSFDLGPHDRGEEHCPYFAVFHNHE